MRWPWLLPPILSAYLLIGCDVFQERRVQLDGTDPVLIELKASVDAGLLSIEQFEQRVSSHLGATTRDIKDDFTATRAAIAEDLAKAAISAPPPGDPSPVGTVGWIVTVLIPLLGAAAYRNLNSGIKKVQAEQKTISSTVATPGPRVAEVKP